MSFHTKFALPSADDLSRWQAMHRLGEQHVTALATVMLETSSPYAIERHEGCDGDLTILLVSPDDSRANLVVTRAIDGFHLAANLGDDYQPLNSFRTLPQLVTALREIIASPDLASKTVLANR